MRARECTPGRSCGPLDHLWSGAARFECWWPLARGNPASFGGSRDLAFGRAPLKRRKQNQYRVFREPRFTRAVMEGGNSYLSCIEQASRTATRAGAHASGTSTRVRLAGGGNRFGMNDQKGAEPSDGERLPTRNKPSEGGALVGMWTSSESSSVGDDELP